MAVDLKSYGAVGDNITDDTQALQQAISATAPGGVLYIPAGTYRCAGVDHAQILLRYDQYATAGCCLGTTELLCSLWDAKCHMASGMRMLYHSAGSRLDNCSYLLARFGVWGALLLTVVQCLVSFKYPAMLFRCRITTNISVSGKPIIMRGAGKTNTTLYFDKSYQDLYGNKYSGEDASLLLILMFTGLIVLLSDCAYASWHIVSQSG